MMKSGMSPMDYQLASLALNRLLSASADYTVEFVAARRACEQKVTVPKYLTEEMHSAVMGVCNRGPLAMWHAALDAAGVLE